MKTNKSKLVNIKKCNCPICNKELVNLVSKEYIEGSSFGIFGEFWCDDCGIYVTYGREAEEVENET